MGKWAKRRQRKLAIKKGQITPKAKENNSGDGEDGRGGYRDIVKENERFEQYYKLQNIIPEAEWEIFMETIRSSLPAAFRVTASRSQAEALVYLVKHKFVEDIIHSNENDANAQENKVEIFPLPWYPGNLAWQMNLTRKDIRKTEAFCRMHNFLMSETDSGNMSRQETVSMIPPLVLNVEPHHKVLDMCAAPGSKTTQIIEFLHADESKLPEGLVIANDRDNKRCYMLVHQAKRLQSPALVITNHDSITYPDIFYTNSEGGLSSIKFDRILCDVPCSGDGTIRKNMTLWRKWHPKNAVLLHDTQHDIVKRGLELLEVGGFLVYSTCSLNPMENEAVVHRILRSCNGCVELQDIDLVGLKHSPGISNWTPVDRDMTPYAKFGDIPNKGKSILREGHFPPSAEESSKYRFEKCIRILPHQQNTGGFFIARFKKLNSLPWEKVTTPETRICLRTEKARNKDGIPVNKKPKCLSFNEDPYIFMGENDPVWAPLREFYQLDREIDASRFLTRSAAEKCKNMFFTTKLVRDIVQVNDNYVKIINTGVKAFTRCDNKWTTSDYRLASEGLWSILPYIKSRIVKIPKEDLVILLLNSDVKQPPALTSLSDAAQEALKELERGACVLNVDCNVEGGPEFTIALIGWRGNKSLRAYVAMHERVHFLRLCGQDVSRFEKNKYKDSTAGVSNSDCIALELEKQKNHEDIKEESI